MTQPTNEPMQEMPKSRSGITKRDIFLVTIFAIILVGAHRIAYPEHSWHAIEHWLGRSAASYPVYPCEPTADSQTITVSFTGSAFEPANVSARACDTLRFVNNSSRLTVPAVGPHPSHDAYPELDAGEPLKQGEVFELMLNRLGTFSFHDHRVPTITGEIIITEPITGSASPSGSPTDPAPTLSTFAPHSHTDQHEHSH